MKEERCNDFYRYGLVMELGLGFGKNILFDGCYFNMFIVFF